MTYTLLVSDLGAQEHMMTIEADGEEATIFFIATAIEQWIRETSDSDSPPTEECSFALSDAGGVIIASGYHTVKIAESV